MNETVNSESVRDCPLAWWGVAYFGTFPIVDAILRWGLVGDHRSGFPYALIVTLIASVVSAATLETIHGRGWNCEDLSGRLGRRLAIYGLGAMLGMLVVYPGLSVSGEVHLVFRVLSGISILAVVSALVVHLRREHLHLDGAAVDRTLRVFSSLPFLLLITFCLLVLIAAIGEVLWGATIT